MVNETENLYKTSKANEIMSNDGNKLSIDEALFKELDLKKLVGFC